MTVAIPEATGAGAAETTAARSRSRAAATTGSSRTSGGRPKVVQARVVESHTEPPPRPKKPAKPRQPRKRPAAAKRKRPAAAKKRRGLKPIGGKGKAMSNYQAVIAAEFTAVELLSVLSPFATRPAQQTSSGGLSPFVPGDLVKMWAIGMVYLILMGVAAGPRFAARTAAWFGLLILLAVGLTEASNLAQIFKTLSGAEVNPIKLVGAQAPATKGNVTIPALGQGGSMSSQPPPQPGKPPVAGPLVPPPATMTGTGMVFNG
jgi:hypothetical protein